MNTCATCVYWTQGRDREMVEDKVVAPASGHCAIHMCMCLKAENQDCCHGFHDWKANPVSREIRVHCVTKGPHIVMPWQPGYEEWAKAHPDLVRPPVVELDGHIVGLHKEADGTKVINKIELLGVSLVDRADPPECRIIEVHEDNLGDLQK